MGQEAQHRLGSLVNSLLVLHSGQESQAQDRQDRRDHPPSFKGFLASSSSFDLFLPPLLYHWLPYSSEAFLVASFFLPVRILFFCQRVSSLGFFLLNYYSFKIHDFNEIHISDLLNSTEQSTEYTSHYRSTKQCLIEIGGLRYRKS